MGLVQSYLQHDTVCNAQPAEGIREGGGRLRVSLKRCFQKVHIVMACSIAIGDQQDIPALLNSEAQRYQGWNNGR